MRRKDRDEKDLEKLAKARLSVTRQQREESEGGKKKDKAAKRLRRPVDSEADT
jgi:hypothetical protein